MTESEIKGKLFNHVFEKGNFTIEYEDLACDWAIPRTRAAEILMTYCEWVDRVELEWKLHEQERGCEDGNCRCKTKGNDIRS